MFRFRLLLPLVLVLVLVAALPTSSQAATSRYCRLFSTSDVGRIVHEHGIRVTGNSSAAPSVTGAKGRLTQCEFSQGTTHIAESSVITLSSTRVAQKEFTAQVKARKKQGSPTRRVAGPWRSAYEISPSEIYMLQGRHIFHMLYDETPTANGVTYLAAKAARKL